MMKPTKNDFLLDPRYIYLNHGGYGAVPIPVFNQFQKWQMLIENQPYDFYARKFRGYLEDARIILADFLNVDSHDIVFINNSTFGLNEVIKSLQFGLNDEVLSTDHEYGALDRTWQYYSKKYGYKYKKIEVRIPIKSAEEVIEDFWAAVTEKTRAIYLSHITSPTAIILPVKEICRRAREQGIFSIIDGAHAPGQIPLDIEQIGADIYVGNLHKWLCAPRGSAFIHARKEVQNLLDPLIISWGWQSEQPGTSPFIDHHEWMGTQDISAFLSVPSAVKFLLTHDWEQTRHDCHALASQTLHMIRKVMKTPLIYPDDGQFYAQMASIPLPPFIDPHNLNNYLLNEYWIDLPIIAWKGRNLLRFSIQSYNDDNQIKILEKALNKYLQLHNHH